MRFFSEKLSICMLDDPNALNTYFESSSTREGEHPIKVINPFSASISTDPTSIKSLERSCSLSEFDKAIVTEASVVLTASTLSLCRSKALNTLVRKEK